MLPGPNAGGSRLATGASVAWNVPSGIAMPGTYWGAEWDWISIELAPGLGMGVSYFGGDSGEDFTSASFSFDIGLAASHAVTGHASRWLVVRPEVGWWYWSESPQEDGLLIGIALGFAGLVGEKDTQRHFLGVEFKWQRLDEVTGDEAATASKLLVAYSCHF